MIAITAYFLYLFFTFRWFYHSLKNGVVKYKIIKAVENYIYFSKLGFRQLLTLDNPANETLVKRLQGLQYLRAQLNNDANVKNTILTDCRFKKYKVLMPLLQELELPTPNYIKEICHENVVLNDGSKQFYLGSDAIHFFNRDF